MFCIPRAGEGDGLTVSVEDASDPTRDPIETDNSACHAAADCSDAHSNHTARRAGDTADCGSGHGSGYHACDRSSHMIHHIAGFTANNHCHFVEVQVSPPTTIAISLRFSSIILVFIIFSSCPVGVIFSFSQSAIVLTLMYTHGSGRVAVKKEKRKKLNKFNLPC